MILEFVIKIFANSYVLEHSLKFRCVLKTTCLLQEKETMEEQAKISVLSWGG